MIRVSRLYKIVLYSLAKFSRKLLDVFSDTVVRKLCHLAIEGCLILPIVPAAQAFCCSAQLCFGLQVCFARNCRKKAKSFLLL